MQRRTSEDWRELIQSWPDSNLTQKEFCARHSIAYSAFYYWFKKFRNEGTSGGENGGFVPVTIASNKLVGGHGTIVAELVLADGRRVNFYHGIDVQFLRDLLS